MRSPLRLALSAAAVVAAAMLVVGCTTAQEASSPTSSASPDDSGSSTAPVTGRDIEAAWLDDGRLFAIVTWGSSSCIPMVDEVVADGQTVTVNLAGPPATDGEEQICTDDLRPRASIGGLPETVDPTKDVELIVTVDGFTDDVDLDGNPALTGTPGSPTEYDPSAGWFDDEGIVLLTWGSSSCAPVVEDIAQSPGGATVTFATDDSKVCTMDMAPRATILELSGDVDDDAEFTLTLVGDNLDGTVGVIRG